MTHKEKILEFVEYKGFSKAEFCRRCSLSISYLDSKGAITSDKLQLILKNFRDLNLDWLLFDEGEMLVSSVKEEKTEKLDTMKKEMKNYKQMYYEQVDKNMLLHEKLLACMEGDAFSKDVG
ncbi:hypothetical protein [Tenacibaculum piscium]|uniref:hypothetical protein n=1 Tax=Tenacibaculum piscium TaxID=1458515 RepID=UPI001F31B92D|nr:hypothetical protein [Tenacibaculum piscium]